MAPYYIEEDNPGCAVGEWATVKEDGEVMGCHATKDGAIDQGVAIALSEESTFEGERSETRLDSGPPAVIVDIDGTLIVDGIRNERLYNYLESFDDTEIIIVTGRAEERREETVTELDSLDIDYDQLIMQPSVDTITPDFKEAVARRLLETLNVMVAVDNNPENRERFRALGITALATDEVPDVPAEDRAEPGELSVGDFVEWDSSGGMARGQISRIVIDGQINVPDSDFVINGSEDDPAALIRVWRESENDEGMMEWNPTDVLVGHRFSTLTLIEPLDERSEIRQVDLTPPAFMRASARRGLQWHEAGLSGDGLMPATVREARAMAEGSVTADKWVRIRAFLARHMVDFDAPAASPTSDDFPSPGVVAIALWGGGVSRRSAQRAMDYADGVIGRIEAENENRVTGEALSKLETRINSAKFEVRETEQGMTFSGYAAVFNSDSQPLPFIERIAPGAFRGSLRNRNDIKLLWNHDTGQVLGSTRAGNLRLTEDDRGLYVEATLPRTTLANDVRELVQTGIVDSMSFGFTVARNGDEWSSDGAVRTLKRINLHEVSIVAFPAYTATAGSTAVRGLDKVAKRAEVDADELADALLKIENGEDITNADRNLITTVLDKLAPVEEPAKVEGSLEMLALKKKKLELLMGY
jgi:HK97 family phage prohead protease